MKASAARALCGVLLGAALLPGYIRETNSAGAIVHRTDFNDIPFLINSQTAPGMTNAQGAVVITPSSDPVGAIRAAAEAWNAIPQSSLRFRTPELSTVSPTGADGLHVVSFEDRPENRDVVGDATAVTLFFSTQNGVIRDTDIYMNPAIDDGAGGISPFSTDGSAGSYDILATVLHEFGHAFGANHTNVMGATMFQFGRQTEVFAGTLAPDDVAFAVDVYPAPGGQADFGRIRGTALFDDGRPIRGGLVAAVNPATGVVIGGLTDLSSGAYNILMPPGEYVVYLESLNGPVTPRALALQDADVTFPFQVSLFEGPDGGRTVTVGADQIAVADLRTVAGPPALDIARWGVEAGEFIFHTTGPLELAAPQLELFLWGPGIAQVNEAGLELLGPDLTLVPGSVRFDRRLVVGEFAGALRFTVNIRPPSRPGQSAAGGSLTTILVSAEGRTAALTGSAVVEADFAGAPEFSAAGVANAASFVAGPIAPGGLVSIFGFDLGPETAVSTPGFSSATGLLPTRLGGVRAEFDGIEAPLVFVSKNQLNLQAPYELAGRGSASLVVVREGLRSPEVSMPVVAAAPGLFVVNGTAGAILNQDSSLNTPANPAPRGGAVIVFGTGQGLVSSPVPTGGPALGDPLSGRNGVTATVGGEPAQVLFAGLAPGFVGLLQVNLLLPENAPSGDGVPVRIFVDGVPSQEGVTLAIAP